MNMTCVIMMTSPIFCGCDLITIFEGERRKLIKFKIFPAQKCQFLPKLSRLRSQGQSMSDLSGRRVVESSERFHRYSHPPIESVAYTNKRECSSAGTRQNQTCFFIYSRFNISWIRKTVFENRNIFCLSLKCPSLALTQRVKFIWAILNNALSMRKLRTLWMQLAGAEGVLHIKGTVWPVKNCQMFIKVAQKCFHKKN